MALLANPPPPQEPLLAVICVNAGKSPLCTSTVHPIVPSFLMEGTNVDIKLWSWDINCAQYRVCTYDITRVKGASFLVKKFRLEGQFWWVFVGISPPACGTGWGWGGSLRNKLNIRRKPRSFHIINQPTPIPLKSGFSPLSLPPPPSLSLPPGTHTEHSHPALPE